ICKCDAFDAEAAVESFLAHEMDHAHIGNRTALGITTGFFNDDWALGIPDRLTKFMIERAVQEIEDEVILDRAEIYTLARQSPRWNQLHDEYEREMRDCEHDEAA